MLPSSVALLLSCSFRWLLTCFLHWLHCCFPAFLVDFFIRCIAVLRFPTLVTSLFRSFVSFLSLFSCYLVSSFTREKLQVFEENQLPTPPSIRFKRLSGDEWPIEDDNILNNGNLQMLEFLIKDALYDGEAAGDNRSSNLEIQFIITKKNGEPVTYDSVGELADNMNWNIPIVTVIFTELTQLRRYSDATTISYQSWYEHIGYALIFHNNMYCYVKHVDIPIGWLCNDYRIWYPPQ